MSRYVITIRGAAGDVVRASFDELDLEVEHDKSILTGDLPDQAALHGVLQRLGDLGIEILEVRREGTEGATPPTNPTR